MNEKYDTDKFNYSLGYLLLLRCSISVDLKITPNSNVLQQVPQLY